MKRKNTITVFAAIMMTASMSMTALAGQWTQDTTGWKWQEDNGTHPANTWQWIDGNQDGVAECYYFGADGYLLTNTTTPDGYTVNDNGAWTVTGVIQTQRFETEHDNSKGSITTNLEDNVYDHYGVNKIAMEMIMHTRGENAKYGEVSESSQYGYDKIVTYANGFEVTYSGINYEKTSPLYSERASSLTVSPSRTDLNHTWLLKFYYPNHQANGDGVADTIEKDALLRDMGFELKSRIPDILDSVWWKVDSGDYKLSMRWYCTDKVFLMNEGYQGYVGIDDLRQSENMQSQDGIYNKDGIDLIACDLLTHSREENNAKYRETGSQTFGGSLTYEKTHYKVSYTEDNMALKVSCFAYPKGSWAQKKFGGYIQDVIKDAPSWVFTSNEESKAYAEELISKGYPARNYYGAVYLDFDGYKIQMISYGSDTIAFDITRTQTTK